ncbi:MAG: bacillithiol biosynthesis cysteine-adding enzyme BshC [Acidobacteria bacterium]|nr:MAG: bacillithiol biosynthesis cysteine-adding enzyme BshC [Acidobacteriota bacterium]PYY24079.1 MAG: bacillithiol biosynthesis cysteine-adding enzyme BshC [Acidobacteriota bacterium]
MDQECLPFRDVPGTSRLFLDFLRGDPQARPFYPTSTLSLDELAARAGSVSIPVDRRQRVTDVLLKQNLAWNAGPEVLSNIEKLRDGACAVVSGQQIGLFLGPAYTLYKAISIIRLSRELTARGVEAVPIFWLASEDHDLAEVNHVFMPDTQGELQRLETSSEGCPGCPVGTVVLGNDLGWLADRLQGLVGESETIDLVRSSYSPGKTLSSSFAALMSKIFSRYGLILLEPSDKELHKIGAPLLRSAAEYSDELTRALLSRSKELETAGYHAQVKVTQASTLLFFSREEKRLAIHRKNGAFSANGQQWSQNELQRQIESNPELFTANVLLRPVLQDYLLPTAAYVAGPAETAYFAQVQVVYERLMGRTTPVWPRFSTTLIEARLASWMRKYGLRLRDVLQPKEDFLTALARRTIPSDIKDDFDRSREHLERLLTPLLRALEKLDPTVGSAGEIAARKMRHQLQRLESRAARAHLRREQVLDRHASMLSSLLFPERELQERRLAGIYFLAKYGVDLIDRLLEDYRPECHDHQVIALA